MSYVTLQDVKDHMQLTSTRNDDTINEQIAYVEGQVDDRLKLFTTVPVSPVPTALKGIVLNWVTGMVLLSPTGAQEGLDATERGNVLVRNSEKAFKQFWENNYTGRGPTSAVKMDMGSHNSVFNTSQAQPPYW